MKNQKPAKITEERYVIVDEKQYSIVISNDSEALSAANAAGRAIVGLWDETCPNRSLSPAAYAVECMSDADDAFLERVVRRKLELPWIICESERLILREFKVEDAAEVPQEGGLADTVFYTPDKLETYIENQYKFYEYGIWAVIEKETGTLIGKAGITKISQDKKINREFGNNQLNAEIGYHIFSGYRRKGYGTEACQAVISYAADHLKAGIYAEIDPYNKVSIQLAENLGFRFIGKRYCEPSSYFCIYECFPNRSVMKG